MATGTMRKILFAGSACLLLIVAAPAAAQDSFWQRFLGGAEPEETDVEAIFEKLDSLDTLAEERRDLPESAFFRRDRADNQEDVDTLIYQAVELLGVSEATAAWRSMRALEAERDRIDREIGGLREERVLKPSRAEEIDAKIAEAQARRTVLDEDAAAARVRAQKLLVETGIPLTEAQMDTLSVSAVGDDIIEMTIVYSSIGEVLTLLGELMEAAENDTAATRRYYGMSVILIRIAERTQVDFIKHIEEELLVRLDTLVQDTRTNITETLELMRNETNQGRRRTLEGNYETQTLTLETAGLYRNHLEQQRDQVAEALAETRRNLAVAENTLETVRLSTELVEMIRTSRELFDAVIRLQMPEIIPFQGDDMRLEFERMGDRLLLY